LVTGFLLRAFTGERPAGRLVSGELKRTELLIAR